MLIRAAECEPVAKYDYDVVWQPPTHPLLSEARERLAQFIETQRHPEARLSGTTFRESRIEVGQRVAVLGTVVERPATNTASTYRQRGTQKAIAAGTGAWVISSLSSSLRAA